MGVLKFMFHRTLELVVISLLIIFIPNLPPHVNISKPYKVAPFKPFEGKLSLNNKLDDVEIWHQGDFLGPEAFADFNGQLYTTVHGGDVVKLVGEHITPVVKFGKPCKGVYQERLCGRPLGLTFDKTGNMYVADAYYGIYKVNPTTGSKTRLISVGLELDGRKVKLPNSVAISKDENDLYWTDSSTEFSLEDGIFDTLADGSGRLVHYNQRTKINTVLIKDVHFANGVMLSKDEDFVLVSETMRGRLLRYYLKGPKKGTHDVFIDGLPGLTDNISPDGKDGFLIPLVSPHDPEHPSFGKMLGQFPLIRRLFARFLGLIEFGFKTADNLYPSEFGKRAVHWIGHFTMFQFIIGTHRTTILHVSKHGEILDSVHCLNQKISGISDAHIFKDTLYLGSPFNMYIAKIPLDKIGWGHLKSSPKLEVEGEKIKIVKKTAETQKATTTTTPKPATTTSKPSTTTTPKPTTTTSKPTTTTPKPATTTTPTPTTQKPTKTTPKQTTSTTPKPTTTTAKPTTTTPKSNPSPQVKKT